MSLIPPLRLTALAPPTTPLFVHPPHEPLLKAVRFTPRTTRSIAGPTASTGAMPQPLVERDAEGLGPLDRAGTGRLAWTLDHTLGLWRAARWVLVGLLLGLMPSAWSTPAPWVVAAIVVVGTLVDVTVGRGWLVARHERSMARAYRRTRRTEQASLAAQAVAAGPPVAPPAAPAASPSAASLPRRPQIVH